MNILPSLMRARNTPFEPQPNVRFVPTAHVRIEARRDKKKFQCAGLGHLSESGLDADLEAKKHQSFKLVVDGEQMTGVVFEARHQRTIMGESYTMMLVECRPRNKKNTPVIHVGVRFA